MFHKWFWATFERKLKFEHFCPGEVIVRQKDIKKLWRTKRFLLAHWFRNVSQMILSYIWAKTKIWKFCFVFAIRFQGFPTFCTFLRVRTDEPWQLSRRSHNIGKHTMTIVTNCHETLNTRWQLLSYFYWFLVIYTKSCSCYMSALSNTSINR